MRILFLDDDSNRSRIFIRKYPQAVINVSSETTITCLINSAWDLVCLDHDLSSSDNGMKVVEWIIENPELVRVGSFIVHSRNAPFGMEMVRKLSGAGFFSQYVPFDERCWAGQEDNFRYQV